MVSSLSVPLAEKDEKNYKFSNGFLLTLFYGDFDGRDRHLKKLYRLKMLILTLDSWLNMSKIFWFFYILVFGMTFRHLVISNFFLGDDIQISRNYQENFFSSVKNVKR
jgi:hypothetical protein